MTANNGQEDITICGKTIDELNTLAHDNPKEFKRWHQEKIHNLIVRLATNSDRRQKYLQFQWKVDAIIRAHGNGLSVAIALNNMLRDKQFELVKIWKPLPLNLINYLNEIQEVFNPEHKQNSNTLKLVK